MLCPFAGVVRVMLRGFWQGFEGGAERLAKWQNFCERHGILQRAGNMEATIAAIGFRRIAQMIQRCQKFGGMQRGHFSSPLP